MKNYYVYEYLREDGTPYYVGKGKNNRAFVNNRTIPKPVDSSRIKLVEQDLTEEDAFNLEIKLISLYGRKDLGTGILRNLTNGGEGVSGRISKPKSVKQRAIKNLGQKRTPEQKDRMRRAQLSRKEKSESELLEISKKISNNRKGKGTGPKSEEHKSKLSQINKGKSPGFRSEETKQKMRKPKSETHKKAISEARIAKYKALRESSV